MRRCRSLFEDERKILEFVRSHPKGVTAREVGDFIEKESPGARLRANDALWLLHRRHLLSKERVGTANIFKVVDGVLP